jgi:hypothetical protein
VCFFIHEVSVFYATDVNQFNWWVTFKDYAMLLPEHFHLSVGRMPNRHRMPEA